MQKKVLSILVWSFKNIYRKDRVINMQKTVMQTVPDLSTNRKHIYMNGLQSLPLTWHVHVNLINCDCVSSCEYCALIKSACAFDKSCSNNIDAKWRQNLFIAVQQGMCTQIAAIFALHDAPKPIKRELSCALFENRPRWGPWLWMNNLRRFSRHQRAEILIKAHRG